ncbi:MAG: hypothetical protein F6K28_56145, partial [Microcoleus sp. SIO2G3]|nr:hypothetical protein [Microcoleus sp. SIO2G3]
MQERYSIPSDVEFIEPPEELDTRIREASFRVEIAKKVSSDSLWICEQAFAKSPLSSAASSLNDEDYNQAKKVSIHALQYVLRWTIYASLVNNAELLLDDSVHKTLRAVYEWLGEPFVLAVRLVEESIASVAGERAGTELGFYLDYAAQIARTDLKHQPESTSYELREPVQPSRERPAIASPVESSPEALFPRESVPRTSLSMRHTVEHTFLESLFRQGEHIITFAAGAAFLGSLI